MGLGVDSEGEMTGEGGKWEAWEADCERRWETVLKSERATNAEAAWVESDRRYAWAENL